MDAGPSFVLPDPPVVPAAIAHLIGSNSIPDGLEERIARAYIAELESQASFLQDVMATCARQHAHLLQSLAAHKPILSPMCGLPHELLAEIFTVVVLDLTIARWSAPWSQPPWTLARVCRRWAAFAYSTPSLWSRFILNLDVIGFGQQRVRMTELLHQHSGSAPLTIEIKGAGDTETRGALNVDLAHCERWQHVNLALRRRSPLLEIATIYGRLPNLTTLKIFKDLNDDEDDVAVDEKIRGVFAAVPKLTVVHAWSQYGQDLYRPPFEFPWGQLTTLSISFHRSKEALPLLPQLSTIVNLKMQFSESAPFPKQSPITLPHLRMLEIRSDRLDPVESLSLLTCLTTPLVEHLGVENEADRDAVLSFIARSGCKLKSFHFIKAITAEDVLSLIHAMPYLLDLKIGDLMSSPPLGSTLSLPRAIHSHWLSVSNTSGGARLSVCIMACSHLRMRVDPDVALLMQKDGLFIEIARSVEQLDSLVNAKFEV
ncbi:hypothetical protein FB45DRAFT_1098344 [Roridomyces roridus]|uniref:F-box domain-containing protein n=1 Tax=Roridomyces roridus TaxID=1738132 RepID=A0AAD7FZD7_9AGAR|nr:hypothetical protein FB45DRAFT_1098344 [Roridomyces roridus]